MSNKLSGTLTLRLPSGDNRFKAFFNVGESGFATEEYVKQLIAESEKKEERKYVEKTDIQDTLNSDNSNKPLSANQGKVLKGLLDAKVIEAGAVPMDTEPTEGNINNVVSSDGLAKEFNKSNTEIVLGGVYDVSAHNDKMVFESLQALLSSSNLGTLIPTSVRHGGMSIRFIQGSVPNSDNKYVQYFLTKNQWSPSISDWEKYNEEKYSVGVVEATLLPGSTTNTSLIWFQQTPKLKHISGISFLAKQGTTNFYKVDTNTTPATITLLQIINNSSEEDGVVKSFNVELELPDGVYLGYNGAIRYAAASSSLDGYIGGSCATDGTDLLLGNKFTAGFRAFCAVKNYVLNEFNGVLDKIKDTDKEIKEKESFEVGIVDSSVLTSYTTNNDVVYFQKTPICHHIDKIRFLAKTGTIKFYKVSLHTIPATITQIKEIVTTSEESNTIKEFDVNVDLLEGEYIGFNGTICYKAISGVPDSFIGASCNIDGTDIQQDSAIAYGYQLVTSVKDVVVGLDKQVERLEYEHISLDAVGTDLSITLPQGTNNTSLIFVIKTPTVLGKGVKINYKARTGTINFYKIHIDTISVGESATITPITSIVNASEEQGNIKSIEVDVDFGENDYLGVNGSFYYMTKAYGADNPNFTSFYLNSSTGVIEDATINVFVIGCNIVVKSFKEIRKTPKNIVFVDAQGNGDYLTLFDAMVALLGKDTATNPYTIVVAPGVYVTPTLSFADKYKWCQNRYLSIVGTDKNNCIIRNDKGYYNADDGLGDNAPIKLSGNIYIANLTIISTDNENASEEDLEYHWSYCIHIDSAAPEGSVMEVHNCRLVNNHAPCIGFGLPKNVVLKITDCELEADIYDISGAANAVICGHDREGASSTEVQEHLMVKNCIIKSSNGDAIKVWNNRGFLADCVFVGNACALPSGKGVNLSSGTTTVIAPSFGNNIPEMNLTTLLL